MSPAYFSEGYQRPPTPVERAQQIYAETVGAEALERQQGDARERHWCCGEPVAEGHHYACSKRPDDEPPAHVDGQEALL